MFPEVDKTNPGCICKSLAANCQMYSEAPVPPSTINQLLSMYIGSLWRRNTRPQRPRGCYLKDIWKT